MAIKDLYDKENVHKDAYEIGGKIPLTSELLESLEIDTFRHLEKKLENMLNRMTFDNFEEEKNFYECIGAIDLESDFCEIGFALIQFYTAVLTRISANIEGAPWLSLENISDEEKRKEIEGEIFEDEKTREFYLKLINEHLKNLERIKDYLLRDPKRAGRSYKFTQDWTKIVKINNKYKKIYDDYYKKKLKRGDYYINSKNGIELVKGNRHTDEEYESDK